MCRLNFTLLIIFLITACSNTPPIDEQVILNSSTNPKVNQRPVTENNKKIEPGNPRFAPIRANLVENIQRPSGSLFNPYRSVGLYSPTSHYQVGDLILIEVKEKTSANKSVKYKMDKAGHFELKPVILNAGSIKVGNDDLNAKFEQDKEFDSSAQTNQKNSLKGDITVYVIEVLNNGNLVVAGEKWITLNTGQEFIRFSGEIRVSDISIDNTILSVKVGNSHIEYSGVGDMQDNQEASLIGKIFGIFD
jgi:flagellar L-ring protein precursor FlgH